jgi:hypothetical protein
VTSVGEAEKVLTAAYRAFNNRDLDAAIELMHPAVDWPNGWEGGRVRGRVALREYWERQFAAISARVEPRRLDRQEDGSVVVEVRQVVRERETDALRSDSYIRHRYWLRGGLIVRMEIEADGEVSAPAQPPN